MQSANFTRTDNSIGNSATFPDFDEFLKTTLIKRDCGQIDTYIFKAVIIGARQIT